MTFRGTDEDHGGYLKAKVIRLNYDAYNALPGDTCLYCLTDRQQMILLALLEGIGWKTRWYSPTGATILKDTVEGYQADLAAALMSDVCSEIMTKLDTIIEKENTIETKINDFELDMNISQAAQDVAIAAIAADLTTLSVAVGVVSAAIAGIATIVTSTQGTVNEMSDDVDNIETIVTGSATEITETGEDVDNIELLTIKNKGNITNIYNQTTLINISLAVPNLTYTADTTDSTATATYARYNAFCAAIVQWIYTEEYAVLTALSAPPTDLATLALQMTATGLNLSGLASYGVAPFTVAEIYAAGNDTAAVNDVACAMINQLTSQKPAYETFLTALDAYVAPAYPDNRWILSQTVGLALAYLDAYTIFAGIYQDCYATALAAAPTAYDCPPCGTINPGCGYQTWDFTIGQKSPWTFNRGVYIPGQGLVGVPVPGDAGYAFEANLHFPGGCRPTVTTYMHFTILGLPQSTNGSFFFEAFETIAGVETQVNYAFGISEASFPTPYDSIHGEWPAGGVSSYHTLTRIRICSNTYFNTPAGGSFITPTYSALLKVEFNGVP